MKKRILFDTAVSLLISVFFLGSLEFLARFRGFKPKNYYPLDSHLGWRMKRDALSFTNFDKNAKVLLLGDSITYLEGHEPHSFTQQLANNHSIPTINLSGNGYSTDQEYLMLQNHLYKYPQVKLVVLNFCLYNDFIENIIYRYKNPEYPPKPYFEVASGQLILRRGDLHYSFYHDFLNFIKNRSAIYYYVHAWKIKFWPLEPLDPHLEHIKNSWKEEEPSEDQRQSHLTLSIEGMPITQALLKNMRAKVENEMGGKLITLLHPTHFYFTKKAYFNLPEKNENIFQIP